MKRPDSFLTNTTTATGRSQGQAINDPGGGTGSGVDAETYNDPAYAIIAVIEAIKEGGISDSNETTTTSDMLDAILEALNKKVTDPVTPANSVSDWDVGTTYSSLGELVMRKGHQYVCYNTTANLGLDPIITRTHWYPVPSLETLIEMDASGDVHGGGFSDIADIQGTNYRQSIEYGRYRIGNNGDDFYNFFRVHLDGTQVTSDPTLEAIFDPGGSNEYWNIDLIAPDVLGTRTLIDMQGRYTRCMTDVGGVVATLGEEHDDAMMRITGALTQSVGAGMIGSTGTATGTFSKGGAKANALSSAVDPSNDVDFDSADSVSPNPAKTNDDETRVRTLVKALDYIVLKQPA